MKEARILVTGAGGFVGRALVPVLAAHHPVRAASRQAPPGAPPGTRPVEYIGSPDLGPHADWRRALRDVDVVVHLAAIAHVPPGNAAASAQRLQAVNVAGTAALAGQAAAGGVRRFILVSSIKAVADHSSGEALSPAAPAAPEDAYGRAKLAGERELWRICGGAAMEGVVLRPAMVYGPRVKGNLALLASLVARGWPLPFGAVDNRRSLLSQWHLSAIVAAAIQRREAAGQVLHACDPEPVSTPALIEAVGAGLGRRARLLRVPPVLLRAAFAAVGRRDLSQRLLGSLEVDGSRTWSVLGLTPEHTTLAGVQRAMHQSHESFLHEAPV